MKLTSNPLATPYNTWYYFTYFGDNCVAQNISHMYTFESQYLLNWVVVTHVTDKIWQDYPVSGDCVEQKTDRTNLAYWIIQCSWISKWFIQDTYNKHRSFHESLFDSIKCFPISTYIFTKSIFVYFAFSAPI